MIIVLKQGVPEARVDELKKWIESQGLVVAPIYGSEKTVLGLVGDTSCLSTDEVSMYDAVEKVLKVQEPFKKANRKFHPENTIIKVGDVLVGGRELVVIAGPCSVESEDQITQIAMQVKRAGASMLRGGAFKPRTSPYAFQGLRAEGLMLLKRAGEAAGLPIVSEITNPIYIELFDQYVDLIQVGARNMQNFELLKELGRLKKPILLKRGFANTLEEMLMACEYIMSEGNENVILCERGIRTHETYTRNTLDLSAVPALKRMSHLPVLVDPSHGCGLSWMVEPLSKAAVAAGADGLIIEVHNNPMVALSDGPQSITPDEFSYIMPKLREYARIEGRNIPVGHSVAYAGTPGSFSYEAAEKLFPTSAMVGLERFEDVCEAVSLGKAEAGVLPVENTLAGKVTEATELIEHYGLEIVDQLQLKIRMNLVAPSGTDIKSIRKIYSKDKALEQCKKFLNDHPEYRIIPFSTTSAAAQAVSALDDKCSAAIASASAAKLNRLEILVSDIQDSDENYTEFVVVKTK
ncbi:MAG: 3-deoxy-7-phosphoheptulonate synthase [Clostridiaceae bacterium]|jgi:3-deoxy-7-phosphoheptulonate synthase|nr:3-deoxy-7-phosphoheptulonate synthase [Bacillota bacterium]NLI37885.1 3-deoxy-7-phosphoheptulonate synthase [Clostridiaceae bacterium]